MWQQRSQRQGHWHPAPLLNQGKSTVLNTPLASPPHQTTPECSHASPGASRLLRVQSTNNSKALIIHIRALRTCHINAKQCSHLPRLAGPRAIFSSLSALRDHRGINKRVFTSKLLMTAVSHHVRRASCQQLSPPAVRSDQTTFPEETSNVFASWLEPTRWAGSKLYLSHWCTSALTYMLFQPQLCPSLPSGPTGAQMLLRTDQPTCRCTDQVHLVLCEITLFLPKFHLFKCSILSFHYMCNADNFFFLSTYIQNHKCYLHVCKHKWYTSEECDFLDKDSFLQKINLVFFAASFDHVRHKVPIVGLV